MCWVHDLARKKKAMAIGDNYFFLGVPFVLSSFFLTTPFFSNSPISIRHDGTGMERKRLLWKK
jgi:hypothetical protein